MSRLDEIALSGIEQKAAWLTRDAQGLAQYADMLQGAPEWITRAEAELEAAEAKLMDALDAVRAARSHFQEVRNVAA